MCPGDQELIVITVYKISTFARESDVLKPKNLFHRCNDLFFAHNFRNELKIVPRLLQNLPVLFSIAVGIQVSLAMASVKLLIN